MSVVAAALRSAAVAPVTGAAVAAAAGAGEECKLELEPNFCNSSADLLEIVLVPSWTGKPTGKPTGKAGGLAALGLGDSGFNTEADIGKLVGLLGVLAGLVLVVSKAGGAAGAVNGAISGGSAASSDMENFFPNSAATTGGAWSRWREDADEQSLMPESLRSLRMRPRGSSVAVTASSSTASVACSTSPAYSMVLDSRAGAEPTASSTLSSLLRLPRLEPRDPGARGGALADERLWRGVPGAELAPLAAEFLRLAAESVAIRPSARIALPVFCVSTQTRQVSTEYSFC